MKNENQIRTHVVHAEFGRFLANCRSIVSLLLLTSGMIQAQGIIATVAGGSGFLDNIPAVQARINGPTALAVDQRGNAYIGDGTRVRRVDAATGIISTVTAATGAAFLAFDANGKLLIESNSVLSRLDTATGALTPISPAAGSAAILAGLATDSAGNIFITDTYNARINRIDGLTGAVTVFAGIGMVPYTGSPQGDGGPATLAGLLRPSVITVDPSGNVFFMEQYDLRRIDGKTGIITTIVPQVFNAVGTEGNGGPYSKAELANVTALATDSKGNLYIADQQYLRKIDWSTGTISAIAGSGQQQYTGDGVPPLQANLARLMSGLVVDSQGNIWIAENGNARLLIIPAQTGLIRTVAGTSANGDGGPALGALLTNAAGLAINAQGDLYVAAGGLRRIDHATGNVSTVAFGPNQLAYGALGNGASPITVDSSGNIFVSEGGSVQRVDAITGSVTTVAGDGTSGGSLGDGGLATKAHVMPSGTAADGSGNLYIADYGNYRIRRVDAATGVITTVAGNGQGDTFSGETGSAAQISIGAPDSIAIARNSDVYWSTNGRILKMNSAGTLSIVAGVGGGCVFAGDGGLAKQAPLCDPNALAFDESGNLFFTEYYCGCIRRIDAQTGILQTVAGTGTVGVSTDGIPATQAALSPGAIAISGNILYLVDAPFLGGGSPRIRSVTPPSPPPLPQPPSITLLQDSVTYRTAFSPGDVVTLFGNYLGPQSPAGGQIGADGRVTSTLSGDQVTFGGFASPLLYVSAGQVNAIISYAVKSGNIPVQITTAAGSAPYTGGVIISPTSLSLFPNVVFNPDGTLNSVSNPAPKGATLVLYGTGIGQTNAPLSDGIIAQVPPYPVPLTAFVASVGNANTSYKATISYLGPIPGFVAGAVQANIQIPDTLPAGPSTLMVYPASGFYPGTVPQAIYVLSDAPVLSAISPASPIPQNVANANYLTLTGQGLSGVKTFNFLLGAQSVNVQPGQNQACTATSCIIYVNFAGLAGQYSVSVTNAAGQTSNQLPFTVLPYGSPTVTSVGNFTGSGTVTASNVIQSVSVNGTNFLSPDTVNLYYKGAMIATFTNSGAGNVTVLRAQLLQFQFDFFGNAGQYAVEVVGKFWPVYLYGTLPLVQRPKMAAKPLGWSRP